MLSSLSQHREGVVAAGWLEQRSEVSDLTSGAAQAFPLLPPLGIAQDVDDQRGKLASVEPGQLLAPLQRENHSEKKQVQKRQSGLRSAAIPRRLCVTVNVAACSCWLAAAFNQSESRKQTCVILFQ